MNAGIPRGRRCTGVISPLTFIISFAFVGIMLYFSTCLQISTKKPKRLQCMTAPFAGIEAQWAEHGVSVNMQTFLGRFAITHPVKVGITNSSSIAVQSKSILNF